MKAVLACLVVMGAGIGSQAQSLLYVHSDALPGGNGQSWATAFTELRTALDVANQAGSPVSEIWVAAGTYRPDLGTGDPAQSFRMRTGLRVLGGFSGVETSRAQRHWRTNRTILSGSLGAVVHSYHVVTAYSVGANALLDGFEITEGWAAASGNDTKGGGIYGENASLQVSHCVIRGNRAVEGAGVYITTGSSVFVNCIVSGNIASSRCGGMYFNANFTPAFPRVINCTITNNHAASNSLAPGLVCSTFNANLLLRNSVLFHNTYNIPYEFPRQHDGAVDAAYCLMSESDNWPGQPPHAPNSLVGNPLFVNERGPDGLAGTGDEDLRLMPGSSAIDSGDIASVPVDAFDLDDDGNTSETIPFDLARWPRIFDDSYAANTGTGGEPVDMGAHEGPVLRAVTSSAQLTLFEGTQQQLDVRLSRPPLEPVDIACVTTGDPDLAATPSILAFDASTWQTPQPLTVSAAQDPDSFSGSGLLTLSSSGMPDTVIGLTEIDDDPPPGLIYVKWNATGGSTGGSWSDAFTTLHAALTYAAGSGGVVREIWVAAGKYQPAGISTSTSLNMVNGVALYGGFVGGETGREQRNWVLNPTILTGDTFNNDAPGMVNYSDNRTHVLRATNVTPSARLDGFIVEGGHAFDAQATGGGAGAGLYCQQATPTVVNTVFRNNWAASVGGAVYLGSGTDLNARFTGCSFIGNLASDGSPIGNGGGGGAVYSNTGSTNVFEYCLFEANSTKGNGGAMLVANSPLTLTGCTFRNNTLLSWNTNGAGVWVQPGGSTTTMSGCVVEDHNGPNPRGGGACFVGTGIVTVMDSVFRRNLALVGAGVYFDGQSPGNIVASFDRCEFYSNQANGGAGIEGAGTLNITVRDSAFLQNSVTSSAGGLGSARLVERCLFTGNTAGDSGGATSSGGSCVYRSCAFTGNAAAGGFSYSGGGGATAGQFVECSFVDNHYTGQNGSGGGAAIGVGSTFVRCEFRVNSSSTWGGATVYGDDFVNCVFTGNTSSSGGGACYLPRRMMNCQLTGNTTNGNGGGVLSLMTSSTATLRNCSLAGNRASVGGGVYLDINSAATTIENCLFWDNTQTTAGSTQNAQIFKTAATQLLLNYTVIQGLSTSFGGVGNAGSNPQLISPRGPDGVYGTPDDTLEIGPGSSCIDSGDNTRVPADTFDLDGDGNVSERTPLDFTLRPRFQDDAQTPNSGVGPAPVVDCGAWEFIQTAAPPPNCYANCDGSTQAPTLTPNDFLCFLNAYSSGNLYANCDGSTGSPVLTPNDFLCFLNRYSMGCQ